MQSIRLFLFALVAATLLVVSSASSQYWIDINGIPSPSVIYKGAHGRVIVGTQSSGIYYSDDQGLTWTKSGLLEANFVTYAIAGSQDTAFAITLYTPTNTVRLYRSTDNGLNWMNIPAGTIQAVAISDSGQAYGVGYYHETSDPSQWLRYRFYQFSGGQWTPLGSSSPFYASNSFSGTGVSFFRVDHRNNFYLGVWGLGSSLATPGLYFSADKGSTWQLELPYNSVDAMTITNSNVLVVGTSIEGDSTGGILQSNDLGLTWTRMGLRNKPIIRAVTVDSSGDLFVATPSNVYRYLGYYDGWTDVGLPEGLADDIDEIGQTSPMTVSQTGTTFVCGKVLGLYRSTDRGTTWLPSGPRSRDASALLIDQTGDIFVGTLGDRIYSSHDQGMSWSQVPADSMCDYVYSFASIGTTLFAGTDCGIYRSEGGVRWEHVATEQIPGAAYCLATGPSGTLYAGTDFGVMTSTDSGSTWSGGGPTSVAVVAIAIGPGGEEYIATKGKGIFRTANGGATWSYRGVVRHDIQNMTVTPSGEVVVAVYGGILRSLDGGVSWLEQDFAHSYVNAICSSGSFNIYAGTHEGIYASYDGGDHWGLMNSHGLGQSFVLSLALDAQNNLYAGTYQGGVYRTAQPMTSVNIPPGIPAGFSLMQNFPNPFNNSTVISYTLPEKMEVTLQVFDILGRQVATLVEGKQEPGVKSIRFDASGLSTGAYFYRLTTSTKTDVRKMIYLR